MAPPPPRLFWRPRAAFPEVCCVCGARSDLVWRRHEHRSGSGLGVAALFAGVVETSVVLVELAFCGGCRRRAVWLRLASMGVMAAGTTASLVLLFLGVTLEVDPVLGVLAVLGAMLGGTLAAMRLQRRAHPRFIRPGGRGLALAIPRYGVLHLCSEHPRMVEVEPMVPAG